MHESVGSVTSLLADTVVHPPRLHVMSLRLRNSADKLYTIPQHRSQCASL